MQKFFHYNIMAQARMITALFLLRGGLKILQSCKNQIQEVDDIVNCMF